jgi:hypothetical protein
MYRPSSAVAPFFSQFMASARAQAMAAFAQKAADANKEPEQKSQLSAREQAMAKLNRKGVVSHQDRQGTGARASAHSAALTKLGVGEQEKVTPNWKQTAAQKNAASARKEIRGSTHAAAARQKFASMTSPEGGSMMMSPSFAKQELARKQAALATPPKPSPSAVAAAEGTPLAEEEAKTVAIEALQRAASTHAAVTAQEEERARQLAEIDGVEVKQHIVRIASLQHAIEALDEEQSRRVGMADKVEKQNMLARQNTIEEVKEALDEEQARRTGMADKVEKQNMLARQNTIEEVKEAVEAEQARRVSQSPEAKQKINKLVRQHSQSAANNAMEAERQRRMSDEASGDRPKPPKIDLGSVPLVN